MNKTEILETIANVVADVCEVSVDEIKSKIKRGDVVEARCMFVHFCYSYGLQPACVAKFLGRNRKGTMSDFASNYLAFSKQSFSFRLMCRQVSDKLSALYSQE